MMNKDDVKLILYKILSEYDIKPKDVYDHSRWDTDLGLDSLDCIELLMDCEMEFNIFIPDEIAEVTYTFGCAVDYICSAVIKEHGTLQSRLFKSVEVCDE